MIMTQPTDSKPIIIGEGQKFEKDIPYYDFIFWKNPNFFLCLEVTYIMVPIPSSLSPGSLTVQVLASLNFFWFLKHTRFVNK